MTNIKPVFLKDLIKLKPEELKIKLDQMMPPRKCSCGCGQLLNQSTCMDFPTTHKVDGKPVTDDCYYGQISELVEENPPASSGFRRG